MKTKLDIYSSALSVVGVMIVSLSVALLSTTSLNNPVAGVLLYTGVAVSALGAVGSLIDYCGKQ